MAIHRFIFFFISVVLLAGCTTSKWTVIDEHAVDEAEETKILENRVELIVENRPTVDQPVLTLSPYNIVQQEYAERIQVQRMVQEYKPKWGFTFLALAGGAVSFAAANTNFLLPSASVTQQISLNALAGILSLLTVTNLEETGEPIETDEIRFLRQTGFNIQTDTLSVENTDGETASISVFYKDEEIFSETSVPFSSGRIDINIGAISTDLQNPVEEDSEFVVQAQYNGTSTDIVIPVTDFMDPFFEIDDPIVQVRSSASVNRENVIAEIGEGSSLKVLSRLSENWLEVEYGSVEAFVQRNGGQLQWRSSAEEGPALLVELEEIPFGEIDVEASIPVLKTNNPDDRAIFLTGTRENQAGSRQLSERDERLFKRYMSTALRMDDDQIQTVDTPELDNWLPEIRECREMVGGSLVVYLMGFARTVEDESGSETLALFHISDEGEEQRLFLSQLYEELAACTPEKLYLFVDLEYVDEIEDGQIISFMSSNGGKQQQLANLILQDMPNAFILYGNRIGQKSSLYSGSPEDDKRHHIFPYFWAEALQQRKTQMSELVRHLENNVDYTARRLHDQPQEVRGFGNFMLDISQ